MKIDISLRGEIFNLKIMEKNYLTKEKYNELLKELDYLKTVGRQEIGKKLKLAKELGDLSENAEYHSVKEEQAVLERKIIELENILSNCLIIEETASKDKVEVGATITLEKNGKEKIVFKLVGSSEADPTKGLISNLSPLGSLLLNKKVGDVVVLNLKGSKITYKILKIE
jgi:transcription elongation factor GreA